MSEPRRVLLVEDDADVREAVAETLVDAGFTVTTAGNGREALQVLRSGAPLPTVILLDLMMPVMDGWSFREEQRKDPAIDHIAVVALTAHADVGALAVQGYLRKPIDPDQLIGVIEKYFKA